ncbi:MAG TPA: peptidoglycan recognition family protein [Gaiellaceae bacterium]|nr:peptidoglycan recognition family protein [Gaiellaceae bacterium]
MALAAIALLAPPRPHIVWKPIPYGPLRKAEMADYAQRHYGIHSWRLNPKVIVEHVTATPSFSSAWNTFARNVPDAELHQLPGTCAHFIIDTDGTIYQLVPLDVMCRHTVGLNYVAIGIEHVGLSDAQVLGDAAQMRSSLALTAWLMNRFHIAVKNVIGHNESLTSPYHKELYAPWRNQTHADWKKADMDVYRARLAAVLRASR